MHPKVAIIVPCYNQARFLPKAIASIQAQTMPDWECIIIDDGSTDETATIAQTYCEQDKRFRIISKENGGSASARDLGLLHAKGEYIQFLDADDTIAPEKLERQIQLMEHENLDISYTAFCLDENGEKTKPRTVRLNRYKIFVLWGLGASTPIHSFMYRTDFIRANHLLFHSECRYREDWRWHMNCFAHHPRTSSLPDYCGAIYYMNEQGKTNSYIRIQEGNFEFMAFMTTKLKGFTKGLWAFRISEELWIWLLRMLKYRSTEIVKSIYCIPILWMITAVLLMPISVWWIVIYFIKIYIAR